MNTVDEVERARAARNAYYREYRKRNPEKERERQLRYWTKRATKMVVADGEVAESGI